jgi:hypothetical protein
MIYIQEVEYLVGPSWDQLFTFSFLKRNVSRNSILYLNLSLSLIYNPSCLLEQGEEKPSNVPVLA